MSLEGQHGKDPTYGDTELKKAGNIITLGTGSVEMDDAEHASAFNLQSFGTDCKDLIAMIKVPQAWPNFSTELEVIQIIMMCYSDFKITYVPRMQNEIADSLVRNARSFYRSLCFIGCSIPIWLPRPPHV